MSNQDHSHTKRKKMKPLQQRVQDIFQIFEHNNPDPKTELFYSTPFTLVTSVILSAQATDQSVNNIMTSVAPLIDTPEKVVRLGLEKLQSLFKSINYYRNKSKYVFKLATILLEKYDGKLPLDFEKLITLPGIGQKTAHVILNILVPGYLGIAVDTHVARVANRLGWSSGSTPEQVEQDLYKCVPQEFWGRVNHWLVLHGRYVCKSRKPDCPHCCIRNSCPSYPKFCPHSATDSESDSEE